MAAAIDRLSPDDLMSLDGDAGTVPMQVGGILWLEPGRLRSDDLRAQLERRLPAAPRLRQVVRRLPFGCGRPAWADDPAFDLDNHLETVRTADDGELVRLATGLLVQALPGGRPPWAARLALAPDGTVRAVVLVVHHVLADGLAALALLTALTDGPDPAGRPFPLPLPTRRHLVADNLGGRLAAVRRLPAALAEVVMALRMLRATGTVPQSSLNRPTGGGRGLVTVARELEAVRAAAHARGGSVNDAALAVVAGALRTVLVSRGEDPERFVISVPFAYHAAGTATGNASAVMPLPVRARGGIGPQHDRHERTRSGGDGVAGRMPGRADRPAHGGDRQPDPGVRRPLLRRAALAHRDGRCRLLARPGRGRGRPGRRARRPPAPLNPAASILPSRPEPTRETHGLAMTDAPVMPL